MRRLTSYVPQFALRVGLLLLPARAAWSQVATGEGIQIPILKIALSLVVCLVLGMLAIGVLKTRGGVPLLSIKTKERRIKVLETTRVNVRLILVLVEVDGRRILLSSDHAGTHLLADFSRAASSGAEAQP